MFFSDFSFTGWTNWTNQPWICHEWAYESGPGLVCPVCSPSLDVSALRRSLCCDLFGLEGTTACQSVSAVTETLWIKILKASFNISKNKKSVKKRLHFNNGVYFKIHERASQMSTSRRPRVFPPLVYSAHIKKDQHWRVPHRAFDVYKFNAGVV